VQKAALMIAALPWQTNPMEIKTEGASLLSMKRVGFTNS